MLVSLVEDHRLFSTSIAIALRAKGFEVEIPTLTSLQAVQEGIVASRPDVVMLDRDLGPLGSGEDLIAPLAGARCPVMVVSASLDDVTIGRCLAHGATVCVLKSESFDAVLATVVRVANGGPSMREADRYRLIDTWRRWQASVDATAGPFAHLTRREAWVLAHLMEGRSVKIIASSGHVSPATVRSQVRGILMKLNVSSQLEAVALALRAGWIPLVGDAPEEPADHEPRAGAWPRAAPNLRR